MTTDTICKERRVTRPNRLQEYRRRAGLTQKELAERLGIKQGNISKAETIGKGLGNETWFRLSDLFNVDPRILRGWNPPEPEEATSSPL